MIRLQKYLSECGICSRRHAEESIRQGEVIVNGVPATIGQSIDPEKDIVKFAGKLVARTEGLVYYAMNKPRGIETTCGARDGKSIVDIVDIVSRVFPIGRLDKDSSGLILLSNDGRLTHRLLHPSFEHEKEYLVPTYGKIDDISLEQMARGVRYTMSEGTKDSSKSKDQSSKGKNFYNNKTSHRASSLGTLHSSLGTGTNRTRFVQTQPCEIKRVSSDTFRIILKEGKNRQIRRMVEACGHQVKRLKRIRIEHIQLGEMLEGAYRELKRGEREELLRRAGIPLVDFAPLNGEVIHGDRRGHEIGFPTANIFLPLGILPDATFSCRVRVGERVYLGAGTFNSQKVQFSSALAEENGTFGTFEVHISNFNADIYGQNIHVDIMDIIRDNRSFSSIPELKNQIEKDVNHVRAHWKSILDDSHNTKDKIQKTK